MNQSLQILLEIGVERIMDRGPPAQTAWPRDGLRGKGYRVLSPWEEGERSGILLFDHPDHEPEALVDLLLRAGVVVTRRGSGVRISPHYYNNKEEVEIFLGALP